MNIRNFLFPVVVVSKERIYSIVFLIAISGVLFAVLYFGGLLRAEKQEIVRSVPGISSAKQQDPAPSVTPIPFYELTIPYLRSRRYQSALGEFEKFSENSSYATYVTSYDSDGLKVNGLLMIPSGKPEALGWPAVVFVHGYIPPNQYQTQVNYVSYADALARSGLVVFKIDLRGHGQSQGEASGAYYSSDYVIDTLNARAALAHSSFVNPKSIGLWGHSMAGNVVFRSLVAARDIPAVAIWAGAVYTYEDMSVYGIQDGSYRPPLASSERQKKRQQLRDTHGDYSPSSQFWKMVVPTNFLDGVKGSVAMYHATNDPVVSIEYSRNLMNILGTTRVPHELHEYPAGGHNLEGGTFTEAMQSTVDFFRSHLVNE